MAFGWNASEPAVHHDGSGWIDTQGRWYAVAYANHGSFAAYHVPDNIGCDPVGYLEGMGWVHVSGHNVYFDTRKEMRQCQIDTLYDILAVTLADDRPFFVRKVRQYIPDFAEGESDNDDW